MSFFKFGKKKSDSLDVPPPPPMGAKELPDFSRELPSFPSKIKVNELRQLPPVPTIKDDDSLHFEEESVLKDKEPVLNMPKKEKKSNFVKIADLEYARSNAEQIREIIKDSSTVMSRMSEFLAEEENNFLLLKESLLDSEKKLLYSEKVLFDKR